MDWNRFGRTSWIARWCRIFYRCVDWNLLIPLNGWANRVASFTDAWIETRCRLEQWASPLSHLLQMRGLKLWQPRLTALSMQSHLLQMRGLKHFYWCRVRASSGRIFYRCVDWNKVLLMRRLLPRVASFTDAWIETYFRRREQYLKSRIFYRCVDWNRAYEAIYNAYIRSHLLQMRGLKLWRGEHSNGYYVSHLLQMRGLKQGVVTNINIKTSRIFYRCVDWNSFLRSNWA